MPDEDHGAEALERLLQVVEVASRQTLPDPVERVTLEEVRQFLVERIGILLDRRPAMLMSILYRVDVAEPKVKRAFAQCSPEQLPRALADLLIERQLEKVQRRRQYRSE